MSGTGWLLAAAGCVVVVVVVSMILLRRSRLSVATVRGQSMRPTFEDGDRLLVARRADYHVGEAIVFRVGARFRGDLAWRVKRIAAVAGDPVPAWMADPDHATVPAGSVVVVGDNRDRSQDSRQLGYIPLSTVSGRVVRLLGRRRRPGMPVPAGVGGGTSS